MNLPDHCNTPAPPVASRRPLTDAEIADALENFNDAVRAINARESVRPQFNEHDGLEFHLSRRYHLQLLWPAEKRAIEIKPTASWDLWQARGFSREAFLRRELRPEDVAGAWTLRVRFDEPAEETTEAE